MSTQMSFQELLKKSRGTGTDSKEEKEEKKTKKKSDKKVPFNELETSNGYLLQEVTSALIKELRRGDPIKAYYWAREMDESGFGAYMWRRLMIFCCEDIGPANNSMLPFVYAAFRGWEENKRSPSKQQFIAHSILSIAESPKNREVDDFVVMMTHKRTNGMELDIPDYALDFHTKKGQEMGRDYKFFVEEASIVDRKGAPESRWLEMLKEEDPDHDWSEFTIKEVGEE